MKLLFWKKKQEPKPELLTAIDFATAADVAVTNILSKAPTVEIKWKAEAILFEMRHPGKHIHKNPAKKERTA
jgi:hypothetical protein